MLVLLALAFLVMTPEAPGETQGTERIGFAGTITASEPIKFINLVPVRTASEPSQDAPPPDARGVIRIPVRDAGAFRWEGPDPGLVSLTFDGCPTDIKLTPSGESTLVLSRLVNGEIDKDSGLKTDGTRSFGTYEFSTSGALSKTLLGVSFKVDLSSVGGVIVNPDPCADTPSARKPPVK